MHRPTLSLVLPIYNEEAVLPELHARLQTFLTELTSSGRVETAEVVFVNDGSRDDSMRLLREYARVDTRYRVLSFARNFGHQKAITAGIDRARGEAVVIMDADLQDPPEVVLRMIDKWREGFDVVYAKRGKREGESWFKLLTAAAFYRLFAAMIPIAVPLDTGDFRLMGRNVVLALRKLRETHRFVRGMVSWVGFRQTGITYDRAARFAGETKYPLRKMLAFAADGIASFSVAPLRFATWIGILSGVLSVVYGGVSVFAYYVLGRNVPGWTTLVLLIVFSFSVELFLIGILGDYVGRIYEEVKRRPLYVIAEVIDHGRKKTKKSRGPRPELAAPVEPAASVEPEALAEPAASAELSAP